MNTSPDILLCIEMRQPGQPAPLYWGFTSVTADASYARKYCVRPDSGIGAVLAELLVCYPGWELVVRRADHAQPEGR